MSLFKRKEKNLIPPLESEIQSKKLTKSPSSGTSPSFTTPSYRSSATTYVASRDGDPYSTSPHSSTRSSSQNLQGSKGPDDFDYRDKYSRSRGVGDAYSRAGADNSAIEQDRNELFSGYDPKKGGSGRFFDGPQPGREPEPGEENDEDVEAIKVQTRFIKQESVNSSRNALMLARQAEDTARGTLSKLGDQSERLANTEMHLDLAKSHGTKAADRTDELKKLNRSIFRPAITFNKDAKRRAHDAKIQERYEEERSERERAMMDVRETQNRLGRAATYGRTADEENLLYNGSEQGDTAGTGSSRFRRSEAQRQERRAQNSRYRFEATASDDEMEDELDENLDEISDVTKRLKALGSAMGQELDSQNKRLDTITGKTDGLDINLANLTRRQKKF